MSEAEQAETSTGGRSAVMFKKRSSRPKGGTAKKSFTAESTEGEADQAATMKGEEGEEQGDEGPSLQDLIAIRAMRTKPGGIELDRLNKGEVKKKKKKQKAEKTGEQTEEDRWAEQMQKGGLVKRATPGGKEEGQRGEEEEDSDEGGDDDDDEDEESKSKTAAPRLVKQNNFQGETGTVDVDKHMMAYIEEEMQKRRQRGEIAALGGDVDLAKAALNPEDELYSIAEKYRKIQQSAQETLDEARRNVNSGHLERGEREKEEGNATLSSAMLTGVPEIDLGIDQRMKNIQETERAKRAMLEAQKSKFNEAKEHDESDFASARFFKYGSRIQSDADIMRKSDPHAQGDDGSKRQSEHKRQTATDDAALERFKKRQRNQLKR